MRPFALILAAAAGGLPAAAADPEAARVVVTTFANDPPVVASSLERGPAGLRARLTLRFANASLAKTGAEALAFDRPGDGGATLRVLAIRQRINPQGDPDIFMPVEQELIVDLPRPEGVAAVAVLNVPPDAQDAAGPPRVRFLDVARAGPARDVGDAPTVAASPRVAGHVAPPLRNVKTTQRVVGRMLRLAVECDAEVRGPAARASDASVELREMNLGDEPPTVADWLFVSLPAGALGDGPPRRLRLRFSADLPLDPRRTLIVGNPVSDAPPADAGPFRTLPIR